jgi:cell surface protein SprA
VQKHRPSSTHEGQAPQPPGPPRAGGTSRLRAGGPIALAGALAAVALLVGGLVPNRQPSPAAPRQAVAAATLAHPDTTRPDTTRPDTTRPDTTRPDTTRPDTVRPDTVRPATPRGGPAAASSAGRDRPRSAALRTERRRPRTRLRPPAAPASERPSTAGPPVGRVDTVDADTLDENATNESSLGRDTLEVDTLTASGVPADSLRPDTGRVARYVPRRRPARPGLFGRAPSFLSPRERALGSDAVALDSTDRAYRVTGATGGPLPAVDGPLRMADTTYRRQRYRSNTRQNWRTLAEQRQRQRNERGGLGVNIVVPGGRESAFSTIFGKPQVDLRVNGQADINAGVNYRKSDRQVATTGNAAQIDPNFKQDLRLGITGTIGDKMQIDVDWDTNNQFDYQNQVQLKYTGYEDEIIQSVEAGNVFLETSSQLINGGQSLFGLKSEFQLGNLNLTTIASQQEGQSNTLTIEGGSETNSFDLKPTDYDSGTHFFLGYYFRNRWEPALSDPPNILVPPGYDGITEIEVWKLRRSRSLSDDQGRNAVALVDLGEPVELLREADGFTTATAPDSSRDQYEQATARALRDGATSVSTYVTSAQGSMQEPLDDQDFSDGEFIKLERGRDYTLDPNLGYISLKQRLRSDEALAVAYTYRINGETRTVGDFSTVQQSGAGGGVGSGRLLLKLLRPANPVAPTGNQEPAAWYLEMRNIYQLGGRGFAAENFSLDVTYEPSGQRKRTSISEVTGSNTLLQALGLDRINQNQAPQPDNQFDFIDQTINVEEGLLIFPYLEPFGDRILDAAEENSRREAGEEYAFPSLYTSKQENAEQEGSENNVYHVRGEYKGSTKEFYDLKAFAGIVEGSVEVTAGGQTLQEGTDYVVDYQGGTVTITNQSYLARGREIKIDYEQNSFANLQKKTLLGARASWSLRDKFALGSTVMRLSQQSPVDKFRVGEEPIKNTIWGVDGSMNLEPTWLTEAVDAVPLLQTRAESSISVSGEFAQLRPGHTNTQAYEEARRRAQAENDGGFAPDERNGISYIDDFEGFENTFSLKSQLSSWQVSAPPVFPGETDRPGSRDDSLRTNWRGTFGWYQLNENILETLRGRVAERGPDGATRIFNVNDVFDRDTRGEADPALRTLDLYFNPWQRGPYNYTRDYRSFLQNPRRVWGGFTQRLPEGYTDFSLQNVEFVEFVIRVFPQEGQVTDGAKLYVNLGSISEDVLPNEELNEEDGLSNTFSPNNLDDWGRLARGQPSGAIEIQDGGVTEDLGLDGLVSYDPEPYTNPSVEGGDLISESVFYRGFLDSLRTVDRAGLSSEQRRRLDAAIARAERDPSGDDYHYFENDAYFGGGAQGNPFFPRGATLQQRFSRYYAGHELNGFETQNELAQDVSVRRGNARSPDSEDLDGNAGGVDVLNDYYEYALPLDSLEYYSKREGDPAKDYVVSEVVNDQGPTKWYKVRIPVREFRRKVGNIDGFTRIRSMRMWTQGHAAPVTMRLASLELVGSQWRTSQEVAEEPVENDQAASSGDGSLRIASINTEEDANYEAPLGAIVSRNRTARGTRQRSREQSLLLGLDELGDRQQRGVFKTYNRGLDLLKYSNLRMYVHAHSPAMSTREAAADGDLKLFVRLGANEGTDYYEYVQPLQVSRVPGIDTSPQQLWPSANQMNLRLSALNQLKVARDRSPVSPDTLFSSTRTNLPLDFAPEGATIRMRGTPSLRRINTVVIGVRNQTGQTVETVEVWANELRVSGYDEEAGWAAVSNATVEMADFATVEGSFQRQTDGFGSLNSTLTERQQSDNRSWNLRTDVNLDKLLPERQGWSIPVTMQLQSSQTTPRFDPNRGDVRLSEIQSQIESVDSLSASEKEARQQEVLRSAQTVNQRRTMTANVSKNDSESWWLRNTVDATSLNFSYFDRSARSPDQQLNDEWSWNGSFEYRLDLGRPRTVDPFGFLGGVPVVGALGDLSFNYVPQSLAFTSSAERRFGQTQNRSAALRAGEQQLPDNVLNPVRERQDFSHRRGFNLQYSPFEFLNLGFDTSTRQTLNEVGADTRSTISIANPRQTGIQAEIEGPGLDDMRVQEQLKQLYDEGVITFEGDPQGLSLDEVVREIRGSGRVFQRENILLRSEGAVAQDLFFGGASPRTNTYEQRFTGTVRPTLLEGNAFDWIDLQDINYQASFRWDNSAQGSNTGATVGNDAQVRTGITLHPNRVWSRFDWFESLKEAGRGREPRGRRTEPDRGPERAPGGAGEETDEDAEGEEAEGEDAEDAEGEGAEEEEGLSLSDLPLPDPRALLRRVALTFLDIRDISVTYTSSQTARSSNVGVPQDIREVKIPTSAGDSVALGVPQSVKKDYSLLDALGGRGPSLAYRFGFDRRPGPLSERALLSQTQASDRFSNQNRLEGRTTLSPSRSFQVDLNWSLNWSNEQTINFRPLPRTDDLPDDALRTRDGLPYDRTVSNDRGSNEVSVWVFGSYRSVVESQLQTLEDNLGAAGSDTLAAGRTALTNTTIASDFRNGFLSGLGTLGQNGFLPVPMPNWTMRYSGLSDWPLVRDVTRSVSLEHGYTGRYSSGFQAISTGGNISDLSVGGSTLTYRRSQFEVDRTEISERFQPLIGVDVTWQGGLQTSIDWNTQNRIGLRTSSQEVQEEQSSEITASVTYRKTGLKIPLLPIGRINNQISFTLSVSRSVNDERRYNLRRALEQAAAADFDYDAGDALSGDPVVRRQTKRLTVAPQLSYSFSNRVTGEFVLEYERFQGNSREPSFTKVNGGFNVQVSLSEN